MSGPDTRPGVLGVRRRLRAFVGVALAVLVVIGVATVIVAQAVAQAEALRDAERTTTRLAAVVVAPLLGPALAGDADRLDELDRAIDIRIADGTLIEVTVWRADGTVVYADETDTIGRRFDPSPAVRDAVESGRITSSVDLADETGDLPAEQRFLEVYVPMRVDGQPPLAFEAYFSIDPVDARAAALATQLILLALVPLVVLQLVQIPIAVSLARRVSRQEGERAALLERALSASERERRTIAADLHDGVVQELAGVGYALGAIASVAPPEQRGVVSTCASSVQQAVDALRLLMVDIYPPDLSGSGLAAAVDDLAGPLRERGVAVSVEIATLPAMAPATAAAVYRVARETLVNVAKHAHADRVRIELGPAELDGVPAVRLSVVDDGVGLGAAPERQRGDGHLGLQMLTDRITDLGGRFVLGPGPGSGTAAAALVPTHPVG
jgi:two-component system NarL family sensor kinase